MSTDTDCVGDFKEQLANMIEKEQLTSSQAYNFDETGLCWKALPSKTLASRREKTAPGYKGRKERVTILIFANAMGDHKLQLTMIGKAKKPHALKDLSRRAYPVMCVGKFNAWVDCDLLRHWFNKEFVPRYLKGRDLSMKALLHMDNAPFHPSPYWNHDLIMGLNVYFCQQIPLHLFSLWIKG